MKTHPKTWKSPKTLIYDPWNLKIITAEDSLSESNNDKYADKPTSINLSLQMLYKTQGLQASVKAICLEKGEIIAKGHLILFFF